MKNLIISILVAFVAMASTTQANAQTYHAKNQSYSIPAYNVPVNQNTTFQELPSIFKEDPHGDRARKTVHCDVETQNPPSSQNAVIAVVQLYSLDGQQIVGPFNVYEDETLDVDVDDLEWGVTILEVMDNSTMSVWVND